MVKKKTSGLRVCIAADCGERLSRGGQARYAKQYCERHLQLMNQLRRVREPCRIVGCKNPAHEDGYCDTDRPFEGDFVPFREDWLTGNGKIGKNTFDCPYTGLKPPAGAYRMQSITDDIEKIRQYLNGDSQ